MDASERDSLLTCQDSMDPISRSLGNNQLLSTSGQKTVQFRAIYPSHLLPQSIGSFT